MSHLHLKHDHDMLPVWVRSTFQWPQTYTQISNIHEFLKLITHALSGDQITIVKYPRNFNRKKMETCIDPRGTRWTDGRYHNFGVEALKEQNAPSSELLTILSRRWWSPNGMTGGKSFVKMNLGIKYVIGLNNL